MAHPNNAISFQFLGSTTQLSIQWRPARNLVTRRSWIIRIALWKPACVVIQTCLSCQNPLLYYLTCLFYLCETLIHLEASCVSCPRECIGIYDTHSCMRRSFLCLVLGLVYLEELSTQLDSTWFTPIMTPLRLDLEEGPSVCGSHLCFLETLKVGRESRELNRVVPFEGLQGTISSDLREMSTKGKRRYWIARGPQSSKIWNGVGISCCLFHPSIGIRALNWGFSWDDLCDLRWEPGICTWLLYSLFTLLASDSHSSRLCGKGVFKDVWRME